jgi:hypothetical protein
MPRVTKALKAAQEAEARRIADIELDAAKSRSMHRTPKVDRDLPPPASSSLTKGWDINSYIGGGSPIGSIFKACSSSVGHGYEWDKTSSQKPRHLYSTELLAAQALRHELAEQFAEVLVKCDKRIEDLYRLKEG